LRTDSWWLQPLLVFIGLGGFVIYATWAALQDAHYFVAPYLSPFYSPCVSANCVHKTIPLIGSWWNLSPAFLVLWVPGGFRATCYYYRKAYYRAFFLDPPACAVGEFGEHRYCGETKFPFILQNLHRYFFYLALVVLAFLWKDAYEGFFFDGSFGMGVGSLVLVVNSTLLSFYTLGCHSLRHLIGGKLDSFHGGSCAVRHSCWQGVSRFNEHHMLWAWCSLFWVGFTDFYVRMVASGMITDVRLF
jgi:hypothetical protein